MQTYQVTGTFVSVNSGTLRLTPEQAAARAHALKQTGKNLYEVQSAVGFKRGEVFGYDGQLNKSLTNEVVETGKKAEGKKAAAPASPPRSGIAAMLGGKKAEAVPTGEPVDDADVQREDPAA